MCRSVPEFLTLVQDLRPRWRALRIPTQSDRIRPYGENRALWFRGQSDARWGLAPKLWREEYRDANEAEMRLAFESAGLPLVESSAPCDKWNWYFLMQHYRAPTRLLDWTISPLIALYFAVRSDEKATQDAAVWVVDPWRWNRAHIKNLFGPAIAGWEETAGYLLDLEDAFDTDEAEKQTKKKWPVAIEPYQFDRRIAAQGSKFFLFGTAKDMANSLTINRPKGGGGKHSVLDKLIIPKSAIETMRAALNDIGINEKAMFPDLEGLGRQIAWEWKSREIGPGEQKAIKRKRFDRSPKRPHIGTRSEQA
ncbi:MAG: FRG domain-containing protein [Candidatus Korobacteraceae bacterium]